jgi:hypothetical protein
VRLDETATGGIRETVETGLRDSPETGVVFHMQLLIQFLLTTYKKKKKKIVSIVSPVSGVSAVSIDSQTPPIEGRLLHRGG